MNLQNHKQQEINFNKETNSSIQKQQKLDFSNPTQYKSQVKFDSKSTTSSFKNQYLRSEKKYQENQIQSKLTSLSDSNLLSQTKLLVQKERKITVEIIEHLSEIDQRKLYLKKGFSNLFDYTTKELGYSEGSAYRRINTMKLCREFPETISKIQNGNLNLTTASQLQTFFEKQSKNQSKLRRSDSPARRNVASILPDQNQFSLKDQKKSDLKNQNKYLESQNQSELRRSDSPARRNVASFLEDQSFKTGQENQENRFDQNRVCLKNHYLKTNQESQNQEKTCLDSEKMFFKRSHFATDSFGQVKQTAPIDHLKMSCLKNTSDSEMASSCLENQSLKKEQETGENQTKEEQVKQIQENQKLEKLKLLKKIERKSSRQTEQLLQEIDPNIQPSKRKVRHLNQDQVEVKIVLNKKTYESLNQLKHLLSHKNLSEGEIFALLINLGLEKYDPRKKKVREQRIQTQIQSPQNQSITNSGVKKSQVVSETKIKERIQNHEELTARNLQNNHEKYITRNSQNTCSMTIKSQVDLGFKKYKPKNKKIRPQQAIQKTNSIKKISRYISVKTRKQVWLRDEGRCTYTCQETKRRCNSKHFLQIDHIQPYSMGGSHEIKNLRLLCASHNQYRNQIFD